MREAFTTVPWAMWGGLGGAIASAAFGVVLRWRRLLWTGFAIPEAANLGTALALGLAAGLVASELPLVFAATAAAVLWLVPVGHSARPGGERAAALCFLFASTSSVLLLANSPHGLEEARSLAVGRTLLFLERSQALLLLGAAPLAVGLLSLLARPIAAAAFDRDHARSAGRAVTATEALFAAALLAWIALAAPLVGAPFLFAFFTVPPVAAERIDGRPHAMLLGSALLGGTGFLVGAAAAVRYDLPFSVACAAGSLAVALPTALVASLLRR